MFGFAAVEGLLVTTRVSSNWAVPAPSATREAGFDSEHGAAQLDDRAPCRTRVFDSWRDSHLEPCCATGARKKKRLGGSQVRWCGETFHGAASAHATADRGGTQKGSEPLVQGILRGNGAPEQREKPARRTHSGLFTRRLPCRLAARSGSAAPLSRSFRTFPSRSRTHSALSTSTSIIVTVLLTSRAALSACPLSEPREKVSRRLFFCRRASAEQASFDSREELRRARQSGDAILGVRDLLFG